MKYKEFKQVKYAQPSNEHGAASTVPWTAFACQNVNTNHLTRYTKQGARERHPQAHHQCSGDGEGVFVKCPAGGAHCHELQASQNIYTFSCIISMKVYKYRCNESHKQAFF